MEREGSGRGLRLGWQGCGYEGKFYGDERVRGPVEFAAYYLGLLERGVISHLEVVSPRQARQLERRFEQDVARVLGVG